MWETSHCRVVSSLYLVAALEMHSKMGAERSKAKETASMKGESVAVAGPKAISPFRDIRRRVAREGAGSIGRSFAG